jgi:hypothetical protein
VDSINAIGVVVSIAIIAAVAIIISRVIMSVRDYLG